jgi:antitoxin MazE
MQTHIARWGNSLALRIPKPIADRLRFAENGIVELSIDEGQLVVRPRRAEPTLAELLAATTPENLPEGFDDGPVGSEAL